MQAWKLAVLGAVVPAVISAAGYAALTVADSRYVKQEQWIAESRAAEIRRLQYRIDELEWKRQQGTLTGQQAWELQRLKSEKARLQEGI